MAEVLYSILEGLGHMIWFLEVWGMEYVVAVVVGLGLDQIVNRVRNWEASDLPL